MATNKKAVNPKLISIPEKGYFKISGQSISDNSAKHFSKFLNDINRYLNKPFKLTQLDIQLTYFNTVTSQILLDIIHKLETLKGIENHEVIVKWFYKVGDDDMIEIAEDFSKLTRLKIELVPFPPENTNASDSTIIGLDPTSEAKHLMHTLSNRIEDNELISQGFSNIGLIGFALNHPPASDSLPLVLSPLEWRNGIRTEVAENIEAKLLDDIRAIGYAADERTSKNDDLVSLHTFISENKSDKLNCTYPLFEEVEKFGYQEEPNSPKYLLFEQNVPGSFPIYLYSTDKNVKLFESFAPKGYNHDSEIIPDGIAKDDVLNRKGLMQVIHKKVKSYWGDKSQQDSFTLLINGPWGSGKSSMLYYLKEFLTKEDNWNVVEYNAWKNQRFENPWWILVNKISEEVPREATELNNNYESRSHWYWKNISQNSIKYRVALVIAVLFIVGFANNWFGQPETLSFVGGLLALIGSAWLAIQGVIKQIFKKQALNELQIENVSDPLEIYKDRFEKVVKHKKVAIFIDDLDRCEVEPTIKLLEGIQTLFKDSKVLYVMAADGQWLVNCFDKKYEDFKTITPKGQTIGNQFLQKTFQLIVDVPKINNDHITKLLEGYLGVSQKTEQPSSMETPKFDLSDVKMATSSEDLRSITGSTSSSAETRKYASERLEETIEDEIQDLEHYIFAFHKENNLPLNPRQIKRIINLYTMKSQEFAITGVTNEVNQEMILNYILFSTEYPKYRAELDNLNKTEFSEKYPQMIELLSPLNIEQIKMYF
ncbi:hypothetical protein GCM10011506_32620 [Marivirga lumbricoides]|uniref:KAP NTPase domain-containing protein n=1 Tax=Marivirga lumbricoides TaxID=1046115 RepID=A0ABQ1MQ14_9BACT|nr:hypothetical protein GCM10011506_32620 [Marivirga lumbricoides]